MTMMTQPQVDVRPRSFQSKFVLLAAGELIFIAVLLRWNNSPAFFAAAVACSLCAIQLILVLLNRFQRDTVQVRQAAKQAEFSSQAVFITDPSGRIKWANTGFFKLTGYRLSDAAGKTFFMLLHGQDTDTMTVESIRNQMRNQQPFAIELMQYDKTGAELWVSSKGEPVCDARGQLTHYVVRQVDLSDQHRQVEEINELAEAIAIGRGSESVQLVDLESDHPVNDPALRLAQQLASLSSEDDRRHLQELIDGMKSRIEECVAELPHEKVQPSLAA